MTLPLVRADGASVEWRVEPGLTPYDAAVRIMEARVARIADGEAAERVWLVEHPPLYTAGTSAKPEDLLDARFPVHRCGRGGQYTYHGPGQRVAYAMLNLSARRPDVRAYVAELEGWMIDALAELGVTAFIREGRVGVWVARPAKPPGLKGEPAEDKVGAIGVRVRRWTTFHGFALNVAPDLSHFTGIVPCGIAESHLGVTSLADLGVAARMAGVDAALRRAFERRFGPTSD